MNKIQTMIHKLPILGVPLAKLMEVSNARVLIGKLALAEMAEQILAYNGIKEPLIVRDLGRDDGGMEILRGHRRKGGAGLVAANHPAKAKEMWGAEMELPCRIVECSDAEAADIKSDWGDYQPLSTDIELQAAANILFKAGFSKADVVVRLCTLMDRIHSMKASKAAELDLLRKQLKEAEEKGLMSEAETKAKEIRTFILDYRNGLGQNLQSVFRCPDMVYEAKLYHASGKTMKGASLNGEEFIPELTAKMVVTLEKAHEVDSRATKNGVPVHSKELPGPEFLGAWRVIVAKQQKDAGEPDAVREKAMGAKDMKAEVANLTSNGLRALTLHHAGSKEVRMDDINAADKLLAIAELVSEGDPDLWAEVELKAEALRAVKLVEAKAAAGTTETQPAVEVKG
jgi:hypothetical protein